MKKKLKPSLKTEQLEKLSKLTLGIEDLGRINGGFANQISIECISHGRGTSPHPCLT